MEAINEIARKEISWYKKNGRYPWRITTNSYGELYLCGDWAWNRQHPGQREHVEARMKREGVYRE